MSFKFNPLSGTLDYYEVAPAGAVSSVFTRTGAVVADAGDYSGFYAALVHAHPWADITGEPTTIGGYGITDFNSLGDARWSLLGHTHAYSPLGHTHPWADITGEPTTLAGYGITDGQPLDAELTALAGLTGAADTFPYFTGAGTALLTSLTATARTLLGSSTLADMRLALGLQIGTNVQAWDADLDAIAALATTAYGRSFLPLADAAAGRTLLELGTMATEAAATYLTVAAAAAGYQPLDGDLTAIAALATTSFGRSFLPLADAAAGRTLLELGALATLASPLTVPDGGTGASSFTAGRLLYGAGAAAIATSANLFWDSGNNRLGIGGTPTQKLHQFGGLYLNQGTGAAFYLQDTSGPTACTIVRGIATASLGAAVINFQPTEAIQPVSNSQLEHGLWSFGYYGDGTYGFSITDYNGVIPNARFRIDAPIRLTDETPAFILNLSLVAGTAAAVEIAYSTHVTGVIGGVAHSSIEAGTLIVLANNNAGTIGEDRVYVAGPQRSSGAGSSSTAFSTAMFQAAGSHTNFWLKVTANATGYDSISYIEFTWQTKNLGNQTVVGNT